MKKALIVYTNGTEDVEATAVLDVLHRGGVDVKTAAIHADGSRLVNCAHGSVFLCQHNIEDVEGEFDVIIVPGGPGTKSYTGCPKLIDMLKAQKARKGLIAAICAAPGVVLYGEGILQDPTKASCYPGCEFGGKFSHDGVSVNADENIITGRSAHYAIAWGLEVLKALEGQKVADDVATALLVINDQ